MEHYLRGFKRLVLYSAAILCTTLSLFAESLTISELKFQVDELTPVDSTSTRLKIFGTTTIVAQDKVEDRVLAAYAESPKHLAHFSSTDMQRHLVQELNGGKLSRAQATMAGWLSITKDPHEQIEGLINALLEVKPSGMELIRGALQSERSKSYNASTLAYLLFVVGVEDPDWLRMHAISHLYQQGDSFRVLVNSKFKQALENLDFKRITQISNFVAEVFGPTDARFAKMRLAGQKIRTIQESVEGRNLEALYGHLEALGSDSATSTLLQPALLKILHSEAERRLSSSDYFSTLRVVSRIDINHRTPTTHELSLKALTAIQPSDWPIVRDPYVEKALNGLSGEDEAIKEAYLDYLEREANFLAGKGNGVEARFCLDKAVQVRPDPSTANDKIRTNIALRALALGAKSEAQGYLSEVKTGVGLLGQTQLLLGGYYVNRRLMLFLALAPLFAGVLYLGRRVIKGKPPPVKQQPTFADVDENVREFILTNVRGILTPRMEEYHRSLRMFDLKPDADLKSIKAAYRNAVKSVHPDMNPGQSAEKAQRFIDLTQTYEKILVLRKELEIPD